MGFFKKLGQIAETVGNGVVTHMQKQMEIEQKKMARLDALSDEDLQDRLDRELKYSDGRGGREGVAIVRAMERRGFDGSEEVQQAYRRTGTRPPKRGRTKN